MKRTTRRRRQRLIEKEYGESMLSVIRDYAALGYSQSAVSSILGYRCPASVRRWLDRNGHNVSFERGGRANG